jgi:hypothetical protein
MKKGLYNAEERRSIFIAKIVGSVLLPLILLPLAFFKLLRQCQLFPDSWICSGESVFLSPAALAMMACLVVAYLFGVYHIFRGEPK